MKQICAAFKFNFHDAKHDRLQVSLLIYLVHFYIYCGE